LDGSDDRQLFCFRDNAAGLRELQSKHEVQAVNMVQQSVSSAAADYSDMELYMSVDDIQGEGEEDEDNEPLIDSDDDDDSE